VWLGETQQFCSDAAGKDSADRQLDVFVHITAVQAAGLKGLNDGQTVNYEVAMGSPDGKSKVLNDPSSIVPRLRRACLPASLVGFCHGAVQPHLDQMVRGRTVPCIACRLMTCSRHERSFTVTASNGSVRPEVVIREGEQLRALLPLRDLADGFGSRPSWVVSWASAAVARPCHGLVPTAQWCGMAMNDVPAASVTARRHSGISLPLSAASACC
jgi:cold shock CspA family protein